MKIFIINSPLFRDKIENYDEDSLPPIGLGIIATSLKEKDFDVKLIDAVDLNIPLDELINICCKEKPDFILSNIFTTNLHLVKEFVEGVNIRTHFIIGGLSTQSLFGEIFNWKTENIIDIVHGDGELICPDIIIDKVKQQATYTTTGRKFFKIDSSSHYFVNDISNEKLDRTFFKNEPINHPLGFSEACIVTSRGCIFNCSFCAAARSLNKEFNIREKSTESIIKDISFLIKKYPCLQSIRVLDDLFLKKSHTIDKAIEIFSHFEIHWRSMAHIRSFKGVADNTIDKLRKCGCKELFIGIESGSPKILKEIHKTDDIKLIKENILKLLRNGINVKGYFIYGFPHEKLDDFKLTFSLAKHLKDESVNYGSIFRTSVFQFRPYHGTELYHKLEKQGVKNIFENVANVGLNKQLSDSIGRRQFNFQSDNYADVDLKIVEEYIYKTLSLNN